MDWLSDSLAAALIAAVLGALGFLGRQTVEWFEARNAAHQARRARLVTLLSLLKGSAAVFRVQAALRDRLSKMLCDGDPQLAGGDVGYEALFTRAYEGMKPEERELQALIRAYTEYGLKPLNNGCVDWLRADADFKFPRHGTAIDQKLCRELGALEAHLLMWLAKFAVWIPGHPAHALVYLADEENHGVPFPKGIEGTIEEFLKER